LESEGEISQANKEPISVSRRVLSLMLELPDMVDKDRLFNFVIGLQPWAQAEVKRKKVQCLEEVITTIDKLLNYHETKKKGKTQSESKKKTKKGK